MKNKEVDLYGIFTHYSYSELKDLFKKAKINEVQVVIQIKKKSMLVLLQKAF